jgi:hypothetical protein
MRNNYGNRRIYKRKKKKQERKNTRCLKYMHLVTKNNFVTIFSFMKYYK